jgi:PST family polysaccharide transporter
MGVASVLTILSGLIKMKVAALLLGPAGVGLIGLYQSFVQTGGAIASLGFGTVGTRQIAAAEAEGGAAAVGPVRQALFWGTLGLSLIGGLLFFAASGWLARHVLEASQLRQDVAWLSLGVVLTVAAGSQAALLTGLRRIGDLARVQVAAGVLGTVVGALAIWAWGSAGVLVLVLAAPLVTFAVGHFYVARLERPLGPRASPRAMAATWRHLAALGIPFMLSGLITTLGNLTARTLVQRELGIDHLGQFQAAWAVGMTYLSFVLAAMATDYFPRLSAVMGDRVKAINIVNEQTEVALVLCGPVILAMLALAPFVVHILYSDEFMPTVEILRWQLLGDLLKILSWPLGFVLLASGAGRSFIFAESAGMGVFVGAVMIGLPLVGVIATGIGFLLLYVVYLPIVYLICRHRIGFRWTARVMGHATMLGLAAVSIAALSRYSELWTGALGLALALGFGLYGLSRLAHVGALGGKVGKAVTWLQLRLS